MIREGLIYLFTSPSYKQYVGQTRSEFAHRMGQHKSAARAYAKSIEKGEQPKAACSYLYKAIMKYGWDKFKIEIIHECEVEELDFWENYYMVEMETMAPKGYNLMSGGVTNKVYTPEAIENFRAAALARAPRAEANHRRNPEHANFPKYISVSRDWPCIRKHPKCKFLAFSDMGKTFDENVADAIEYLNGINDGTIIHVPGMKKVHEPPKYIHSCGKKGWCFRYNDKNIITFNDQHISRKENLQYIIKYRDKYLADLENNK